MWGSRPFSAFPRVFSTPVAAVLSAGAASVYTGPLGYLAGDNKTSLAEEWDEIITARKGIRRGLRRTHTERIRVELGPQVQRHYDNPVRMNYIVGACSVASNNPNEDRFIRTMVPSDGKVILAGVFDGHGGSHVADFVASYMPAFMYSIVGQEAKEFDLSSVMLEAHKELEADLLDWTRREVDGPLAHGRAIAGGNLENHPPKITVSTLTKMQAGACAVTVLLGEDSYCVANLGDCRAMRVRREIDGKRSPESLTLRGIPDNIEVDWLTAAHNADSPTEQERLIAEHPGEEDLVHCKQKIIELDSEGKTVGTRWGACYVKGRLQPTRAFGDFYFKDMDIARVARVAPYPHEQKDEDDNPLPNFTPPYISATPDVRTEQRDPTRDMFLILASDGLWDYLPDPDIVSVAVDVFEREGPQAAAEALVSRVIEQAAQSAKLSASSVRRMQPGRTRRNIHDDVTVVIVRL
ncbi:hypothetical protein FOL47_008777 [Perkinsus chesapeaki]|uniref:PPM-type phosphatase domain-containing protein n=1 Tax=Perkinsus chesapeaki TaxID=330153 RepID=A0A7J6MTR3_PERCH|nr:hypothetical protein FOL47_008777 [Perkinsus chesapeaki]